MLDKKDRRILFELDINARQSFGEIASKVGLSKSSVLYRINNLEKENVILDYLTIIDTMRLGYTTYDVYLKFTNTTPEKEQEIIDYLISHKRVWFVVSTMGSVELVILISTKSASEYYKLWEEIYAKIKPFVHVVRTTILVEYSHFSRNYLLPGSKRKKKEIFVGKLGNEKIDDKDHQILRFLSKNARMSIIDVARHVRLTSSAVIYRIRELERKGIIQGYRSNLNFRKLGYEYFKVMITLNSLDIKKKIITWVKTRPNVVYYDGFIGGHDIEFDIEIESTENFVQFLKKLKEEFGTSISSIDHFMPLLFHKSTYYPDER